MILYGAGGHGKVVSECLSLQEDKVIGVFDDEPGKSKFGQVAVSRYNTEIFPKEKLIISIGNNSARFNLSKKIQHAFGIAIHDSSFISKSSEIGHGSMVMAKSIIQAEVKIGTHVIINSGAIIEHDSTLGDYVHVGPGAVVCGNTLIKRGTFIGANTTILPGVRIGEWAVIGAGSVVIDDVENGVSVVGNPAKRIAK
jgi:sugar O-acyltransferase (sialic acid O-acetyltransferase NeuD family)